MNYYYSANKTKGCTMMVYPANGYIGYMICKEMAREAEYSNGQKMEVKEVLAVCCGTEGMYGKLKEMGKPIKTIVLEDASRMSEWKKEMKGRKCDAMMLCTEGVPHHRNTGIAQESESGQLKKFVESMENAIEMSRHMDCKTVAVSTSFAANESKYTTWNHIYTAMEKACKKHVKGNCATLFHNMMFEILYLNRDEISQEKILSWPVAEDANFCPMAAMDFARCCICAMHKMMQSKTMKNDHKRFYLTGRDKMTPNELVEMMCEIFDIEVQYNEVDCKEWRRKMEKVGMLCPLEMCLAEEVFKMMEKGGFKKCTDDCKKLSEHKPMKCEEWLDEHRKMFEASY